MSAPGPSGLSGARVLVTGGAGFLGRHLVERLERERPAAVLAPSHADLDLLDADATEAAFRAARADVVIHAAGRVGGIGANQRHPAVFWRDNLRMGLHVLEASRAAAVRRVVVVGTVCAYPKVTPVPFREEDLWNGFPEETNAPYGVAKRALAVGLDAYRREFGMNGAFVLPANLYGPHDDFDLESSHAVAAILRKCVDAVDAGATEVALWGTGRPSREFLYVKDGADGIVRIAGAIDDPAPINLGTGREVSIRDLAAAIARATGYSGSFRWDPSKPDGQPRRSLDVSEAVRRLGWRARTRLEEGLAETVAWYREARKAGSGCGSSS